MNNNVLLSILIPITPDRVEGVKELLARCGFGNAHKFLLEELKTKEEFIANYAELLPVNEKEIIISCDNKVKTLGEKREELYRLASGVYSIQIDSDDLIADDAISLILQAVKAHPGVDCVTFRENCMMNGEYKSSNHSLVYEKWQDNFDGYDYVRCPFYKDVIRTEIAQSVPFPKIRYGEDEQWSMALRPHLKTEYHIDKELYYYIYAPKDTHEERYGFNRNA